MSRRVAHGAAALLVLAVAAAPRLLDLGRPGLTYDEIYDFEDSLEHCRAGSWQAPISDGYLNGQAPFLLACVAYELAGTDEVRARALTVAASLLAVAATMLLARRHLPARWALLAALLLGLSPFFLSASRLAFSHGHVFAVPWLLLSLREALASRPRLARPRAALASGFLAGLAAGHDLLALPWLVTLLALGVARLHGGGPVPLRRATTFAARFALAGLLGLALASPMYLAAPLTAVRDVAERLAWWGAQREHLWLGREVATVPAYYYALVLAVKTAPPLLALALLAPLGRGARLPRLLLLCCWPVVFFSLRAWKSPFYLMPFLPLLYLLATHSLRRLRRSPQRWLRGLAPVAAGLGLAFQLGCIADAHPDHLMLGIRYSQLLYGDFQGPAVSHGQWVRAALEWVRADAAGSDPVVVVPAGTAPRQVAYYSARLGLSRVYSATDLKRGVSPRSVQYAIVSSEPLAHEEGRLQNAALTRLVAQPGPFGVAGALRSSGFVTARVWRRLPAEPRPGSP